MSYSQKHKQRDLPPALLSAVSHLLDDIEMHHSGAGEMDSVLRAGLIEGFPRCTEEEQSSFSTTRNKLGRAQNGLGPGP